jgi:hypothetical protein
LTVTPHLAKSGSITLEVDGNAATVTLANVLTHRGTGSNVKPVERIRKSSSRGIRHP